MGRNIVVCLDGTGNQVKANGNTNVLQLYSMLDLTDPDRQIAFYDPGVGTAATPGAWTPWAERWTKLTGLALGTGIRNKLEDAYSFLVDNYRPGDSVYIFGFSRGAFTARGLAGLTYRVGVMRPGADNLVPYLVKAYTKGNKFSSDDWGKLDQFADTFSYEAGGTHAMPIAFMGLWDTVKALRPFRRSPAWPYTRALPNAAVVRHAVSIDERRRPYREYLVDADHAGLTEAWFSGVHSDVGGGFDTHPEAGRVTLKWMIDGALEAGLLLRPEAYAQRCTVDATMATQPIHRMGAVWLVLGRRRRAIPAAGARLHETVRIRMSADLEYRPTFDTASVTWDDPDWTVPSALAG